MDKSTKKGVLIFKNKRSIKAWIYLVNFTKIWKNKYQIWNQTKNKLLFYKKIQIKISNNTNLRKINRLLIKLQIIKIRN